MTTRVRARIAWPGKPPLENHLVDLVEDTGRHGLPDWRGSFMLPADGLRHVDINAEHIRIELADGRAGDALPNLEISSERRESERILVRFTGATQLARADRQ